MQQSDIPRHRPIGPVTEQPGYLSQLGRNRSELDKLRKSGDSCGARLTDGFLSNNAGGILGGISTGQDIVVSIAVKPTSSIRLPRKTIDIEGNAATIETHGRHDPCVGIRATPIAEAFLALVLIDHALRQRAQNGDVKGVMNAVPGQLKDANGKSEGNKLEDPDPLEA